MAKPWNFYDEQRRQAKTQVRARSAAERTEKHAPAIAKAAEQARAAMRRDEKGERC